MKKRLFFALTVLCVCAFTLTACGGAGEKPSAAPSIVPSATQSVTPTEEPSATPSIEPSVEESGTPSVRPTEETPITPSANPSVEESGTPTVEPSVEPTIEPSIEPTVEPTVEPSVEPAVPSEGLEYLESEEGVYVTALGSCGDSDVVIPSTYNGKAVVAIVEGAFYYCENVTSVTIPNSVIRIGAGAFAECVRLTTVVIPESVTSIAADAFFGCSSLTSITVSVNNAAYQSIDGNLYSKDGKTLIQYAVGKPDTAFTVPNGVTSIKAEAFRGCSTLTSITVSDSVTSIEVMAFRYCSSLTSITVSVNNATYQSIDGNLYSKDGKTLIQYAVGKTDVAFVIPEGVTTIGERAFAECKNLTNIVLPESVTTIEFGAFEGCSSLQYTEEDNLTYLGNAENPYFYLAGTTTTEISSATINANCKMIGSAAFESCNLTSIVIPESVTTIGEGAFQLCVRLTSVVIGKGVIRIGNYAFSWCDGLKSVYYGGTESEWNALSSTIDSSNTELTDATPYYYSEEKPTTAGNYWHYGEDGAISTDWKKPLVPSKGLKYEENEDGTYTVTGIGSCWDTELVIPSTYNDKAVTRIGPTAFHDCRNLTSVVIPDSVTSIGNYAFWWCTGLTTITLGNGITSIESFAFMSCTSLQYTVEDNLKYLGTESNPYFYLAETTSDDISSATINENCKIIGSVAFSSCKGLTSITIPEGVTNIGDSAFSSCKGLTSVTIPDSVTGIEGRAFYNCICLTNISVSGNNAAYQSIDGNLYSKDGKTLVQYAVGKTDTTFTVPNGVTSIGEVAFYGCSSLTSVTIPEGVASIGDYAFGSCASLASVTIPGSVTSICEAAFQNCSGLTTVTLGNGVTSIGLSAFDGCSSLTSITIPDSVTGIEGGAFRFCTNLTTVTIPEGVTSIEWGTFDNCAGLTSITIPDSVTSIGDYAFWKCTGLTSVVIPNSVTRIGEEAFYGCKSLTDLAFSNRVTDIGEGAFYGCDGLTTVYYGGTEAEWNAFIQIDYDLPNEFFNTTRYYYSEEEPTISGDFWHYDEDGKVAVWTAMNSEGLTYEENDFGTYTVTGIGSCTDTELVIPSTYNGKTVTAIKDWAFYDSKTLTSVAIPDSVTSIGEWAFSDCKILTSITVGTGRKQFGDGVFANCIGLKSVTFGNGVLMNVGQSMFFGCSSLTTVTLGDDVTSIEASAFSWCGALTSVTIGKGVGSIGNEAFRSCTGLKSVYYGGTEVDWKVLSNSIGSNNTLLTNATRYYYSAEQPTGAGKYWYYDENGEIAVWPSLSEGLVYTETADGTYTVTGIGSCTDTELVIPSTYNGQRVTTIGEYAFQNKTFTSVTLSQGIETIGVGAFYGCWKLETVSLPESLSSVGEFAFSGTSALAQITISPDNRYYQEQDGVLYTKDMETVVCYPAAKTGSTVILPETIRTIGTCAFERNKYVTTVVLPDGLRTIGNSAFSGCSALAVCNFPEGLEAIEMFAFNGCVLSALSLPASVNTLGTSAFTGCPFTEITVAAGNAFFQAVDNTLYTANGDTLLLYAQACGATTLTVLDGTVAIADWALSDSSFTSVVLPVSLKDIGAGAFYFCENLKNVYYRGTQSKWYVNISHSNDEFYKATRYYYSEEKPTTAGNYWHYDENGEISTVWSGAAGGSDALDPSTKEGWDAAFAATVSAENVTTTWEQNNEGEVISHKANGVYYIENSHSGSDAPGCYYVVAEDGTITHYERYSTGNWQAEERSSVSCDVPIATTFPLIQAEFEGFTWSEEAVAMVAETLSVMDGAFTLTDCMVKIEDGVITYLTYTMPAGGGDDVDQNYVLTFAFTDYGTTTVTLPAGVGA